MAAPATFETLDQPDPVAQHRELRRVLRRWLLLPGGALLLLLAYFLFPLNARTPLADYHFRQLGVQPDGTWWILAYRTTDGQAEVLFSRDTTAGWQRHALGVDSTQARVLALNWGNRALLLGDTTVQIYNDSLKPAGAAQHPFGRTPGQPARWLAVDTAGERAVVATDSGAVYAATQGGTSWAPVPLRVGGQAALQAVSYAGTEPGADFLAPRFGLVSRRGYVYLNVYNLPLPGTGKVIGQTYTRWATSQLLPATVAWCGLAPNGLLIAYDRQGNWATARARGQDAEAGRFFGSVRSAVRVGNTNRFLGVSATRLYEAFIDLPSDPPPATAGSRAPTDSAARQAGAQRPSTAKVVRWAGPSARPARPAATRRPASASRQSGATQGSTIPLEDPNRPLTEETQAGPTGTGDNRTTANPGQGGTPGQGGSSPTGDYNMMFEQPSQPENDNKQPKRSIPSSSGSRRAPRAAPVKK